MERIIQVATTWANGSKTIDIHRYSQGDMTEIFTIHELIWLSEGKIVESNNCEFVDLQAWFERTNK